MEFLSFIIVIDSIKNIINKYLSVNYFQAKYIQNLGFVKYKEEKKQIAKQHLLGLGIQ